MRASSTFSASPSRPRRNAVAVAAVAFFCAGGGAVELPHTDVESTFRPDAYFSQLGVSDEVASGTVGAMWTVPWALAGPRWSMYVEASVSRWQSRDGREARTGFLTQLAWIPVFRYRLADGQSRWFVEGGIGATVTSSVYRSKDSGFSTSFNFGDHVGVGYAFGERREHEVAIRVQHFSNAGIKRPNPGQDFLQLRYVRRFD